MLRNVEKFNQELEKGTSKQILYENLIHLASFKKKFVSVFSLKHQGFTTCIQEGEPATKPKSFANF